MIACFFLSLLARTITIFVLGRHLHSDVWEYDTIATNILSGRGYVFNHNGTEYLFFPNMLYSYLSAAVHFTTHRNYLIVELLQVLIASFSVVPLMKIAARIFDEKTAIITGLLYSFHPGLIVYSSKLHELTLVIFFLLVILRQIFCRETRARTAAAVGFLIAVGIFLRTTFVFLIPAVFIYDLLRNRQIVKAFYRSAIMIGIVVVMISPWVYRGYRIYNRFIFITTCSAEHLWRGNSPYTSGTSLTAARQPLLDVAPAHFRNRLYSLNEIEQHDFFKEQALAYIREDPAAFARRTIRKFIYFWSFSPQTGYEYPAQWLFFYQLWYWPLVFFSVLGLFFTFKDYRKVGWPEAFFLFIFAFIIAFVHSICYVETRHRWMIEPLLMVFPAYGLARLVRRRNMI